MASRPGTINEYLAELAPDQKAALQRLRATIRSAAPRAKECIYYGLPAFRQGKPLVAFGARPKHCSFFLLSSTTVAAHRDLLEGYDTSAGTIRFWPDEPLPVGLVRKLVRARIAENERQCTVAKSATRRSRG